MNVFLMHTFVEVRNNLSYCFCVPNGGNYAHAKEVAQLVVKQLEEIEAAQNEAMKAESVKEQ